jgi:hypothetical protein
VDAPCVIWVADLARDGKEYCVISAARRAQILPIV